MKIKKMNSNSLLVGATLSLALVNLAGAATTNYVYMTGSTAARGQIYNTLNDPGVVFTSTPKTVGQGDSTLSKCGYMLFSGTLVGDSSGAVTTVKCHWSGSEAGIADLVGGTQQFLDDSASSASTSTGPYVSSPVDLAMADTSVAFSLNPGAPVNAGAFVGVIPFKLILEKGSLSTITNVTDAQLRVLLAGGSHASLLTGNSNDVNYVYISGRDEFSGTRVNAYGIPRYGIGGSCNQVKIASDGSMVDLVPGTFTYVGNFGYSSGGDLAKQMGYDLSAGTSQDLNTGSGNHFSVIAYLGYSDASSALTANGGGAVELSYNGVLEGTDAVREGKYGLWGNEYLYGKSVLSSQASAVYNLLAPVSTGINAHADNIALIDQRTMHATRNGPTSDPTHN
jgi:hypothetical protein